MATKKKENNENTKVSGKKADASAVNNAETEAAREIKRTFKPCKKEKEYVGVSGNQ